jgi:hypothetical protein
MRYWQMRAARLSTASQKLEADGQWHPMRGTPHAWYRVGKGRIVQRANFDNESEEQVLLEQIMQVDPLPEMATVTGFREEIRLTLESDAAYVILPLGYALEAQETLRSTLDEYGIDLQTEDSLIYAYVPVLAINREELIYSQNVLTTVRLLYQALKISGAKTNATAAVMAFRTAIENIRSD